MPRGLVNARAKVGPLTLPRAVLIGAAIIASAILVVPMLAPYRFQAAMLGGFWQFNAVTGEGATLRGGWPGNRLRRGSAP
jgi:hypothetical protein